MVSRRTFLSLMATIPTAGCSIPTTNTVGSESIPAINGCDERVPWPTFQGGPRRLGRTATAVGPSPESRLVSSEAFPSGRTGRVVCTEELVMVTWERSGTVFRYHRSTGEMDSLELDQPTRVYPGVHCSTLVVPTGSVRYRIDVNDWTVLDERSTATPYASPLFDGNRLYVTGSGGLQAVGADEGLLWTYSNDRLVTGIASTDEAVYAVESNADGGRLTVLDAETGDVHWRTDRIGETYADPVVGRNVYVTNAAGHVLALDRENGEVRWTHRTGTLDSRFTVPAVGDDAVFVADEDTGSVRAVGRTDGETRWETPIYRDADGRRRAGTLFAPVLTEQGVLVSAGSAGIIGLLREDGQRFYRDASRTLVSPLGAARKTIYGATPSGLFVLKLSG